jgi:hypothetical protein
MKTYGWRFVIFIIIAAIAFAYIVRAERKASGLALAPVPAYSVALLAERLAA